MSLFPPGGFKRLPYTLDPFLIIYSEPGLEATLEITREIEESEIEKEFKRRGI